MRTVAAKSQYQTIALTSIHESATNPRRSFDESKLTELADSLRTQGLIQPITVRRGLVVDSWMLARAMV